METKENSSSLAFEQRACITKKEKKQKKKREKKQKAKREKAKKKKKNQANVHSCRCMCF